MVENRVESEYATSDALSGIWVECTIFKSRWSNKNKTALIDGL
jgi:hypothetical protein